MHKNALWGPSTVADFFGRRKKFEYLHRYRANDLSKRIICYRYIMHLAAILSRVSERAQIQRAHQIPAKFDTSEAVWRDR